MVQPEIRIKYNPVREYKTATDNVIGQGTSNDRGWYGDAPWSCFKAGVPAGEVYAACKLGDLIVVCGDFTDYAAYGTRAGIVAFYFKTGVLATQFNITFDGSVPTALCSDGTYVYVGGSFTGVTYTDLDGVSNHVTNVSGYAVTGLVRFDYMGQLDTTWNPRPNANPSIKAMAYHQTRETLLVGGDTLTSLGGASCSHLSEVGTSLAIAAGFPFEIPHTLNGDVKCIFVEPVSGDFYVGGLFTNHTASNYNYLLKYNVGGTLIDWAPSVGLDGGVYSIYAEGNSVWVGGVFTVYGALPRPSLACFEALSGNITSYAQTILGTPNVKSICKLDNMIFIAGVFTTVGGLARTCVANTTLSGAPGDFAPALTSTGAMAVNVMLRVEKTFYIFGRFDTPRVNAYSFMYPEFSDINTIHVSKYYGSDSVGDGTNSLPYATIGKAYSMLSAPLVRVAVIDSATYNEQLNWATGNTELYAYRQCQPTISLYKGAVVGTYGARETGRTTFSTGLAATFYYVSASEGNDATGARGDITKPFKTIQAALSDGSRVANDTIQVYSGTYVELLNIGAIDVTIQAANGEAPIIQCLNVDTSMVVGSALLSVYGMTIIAVPGSGTANTGSLFTTGNVNVVDCTFEGNNYAISASITTGTSYYTNCIFRNVSRMAVFSCHKAMVTNCYFYSNGNSFSSASCADLYLRNSLDGVVDGCSFIETACLNNGMNGACIYIDDTNATAATNTVQNCYMERTKAPFINEIVHGVFIQNGTAANRTYLVKNCYAKGMLAEAFYALDASGTAPKVNTVDFTDCVAEDCCSNIPTGNVGIEGAFKMYQQHIARLTNCVALSTYACGVYYANTSSTGGDSYLATNCAVINSTAQGFRSNTTGSVLACIGCIEKGATTNGYHSGAVNGSISYSCIETTPIYGTSPTIVGSFFEDPKVINALTGYEVSHLSGNSLGVLTGNQYLTENMGTAGKLFRISGGGNVVIDGFIISGEENFHNGIVIDVNLLVGCVIRHCTFRGLGQVAVRLTSKSIIEYCLFDNVNGMGIQTVGEGNTIRRCLGYKGLSAFIWNGGGINTIKNNTGYFNEYGQFDGKKAVTGTYKNNVLSENIVLDYSGVLLQDNSCVGSISEAASIPNVRGNPLFISINVDALDFHLQSQNSGDVFQSPAIDIGDDGKDAGCYETNYYAPLVTWVSFTLTYNPDNYKRTLKSLKLAEGNTYGGLTYSASMGGMKVEHELNWEGTNPMTPAQLYSLLNIFNSPTSEIQVSFDAGYTFIPCRILKSVEPYYTELEGLGYSDDGVPTPLQSIVFVESV